MGIKQGCQANLGTFIEPGKLLCPLFSLPDVFTPQFLEPGSYAAHFGEVEFYLVQSGLVR